MSLVIFYSRKSLQFIQDACQAAAAAAAALLSVLTKPFLSMPFMTERSFIEVRPGTVKGLASWGKFKHYNWAATFTYGKCGV